MTFQEAEQYVQVSMMDWFGRGRVMVTTARLGTDQRPILYARVDYVPHRQEQERPPFWFAAQGCVPDGWGAIFVHVGNGTHAGTVMYVERGKQ